MLALPGAIGGASAVSWGVSQIIAGIGDSQLPFPNPTLDFLFAYLATGDMESATNFQSWVDMSIDLLLSPLPFLDMENIDPIDVIVTIGDLVDNFDGFHQSDGDGSASGNLK